MENRKFIGVGMTRRVYSLGDGTCLKEPIPGREAAGELQNEEEYANTCAAESCGIDLFPKIIKYQNFKMISEECKPTTQEFWNNVYNELRSKCEFFAPPEWGFLKWFMFTLNDLVGFYIHDVRTMMFGNTPKFERKITDYDELVSIIASVADTGDKYLNNFIVALKFILKDDSPLSKAIRNVIRFKVSCPDNIIIAEMWNFNQWGVTKDGRLVIIDSGYTYKSQHSGHYKTPDSYIRTNLINKPGMNKDLFNGFKVTEIRSPKGGVIDYKFYTDHGSEYIMSSDCMSRRIKQAGLKDDGLHDWKDMILFVKPEDIYTIMEYCKKDISFQRPVKIDVRNEEVTVSNISSETGEWQKEYTARVSRVPVVGMHTFEYKYDGDGIVRGYHPGHQVSQIDYRRIPDTLTHCDGIILP